MRIAHLILAHTNPEQLKRLALALAHPAFDLYVHVDAKVSQAPFELALQNSNVSFISNRAKIYWGDWGTIQATLNGFEELVHKDYDYINVISGQDFPLKPAQEIFEFYEKHNGKEFITCDYPEGEWSDAKSRIDQYHLINWRFPLRHRLEKIVTAILPRRKFPLQFDLVGRSNWFTLSQAAVIHCMTFLKENPAVKRYFRFCWGADEFIFSTILYNSSFKNRVRENLVYVNWDSGKRGHPKLLDMNDYNTLCKTNKLFARKFDSKVDNGLLNAIEQKVLNAKARKIEV